ncbi:MAG TPA: sensor domain-containing protein [Mycobacterium sp.]|nr:sensor domain-containing protein [Mycobacterium sp.]
MLLSLVGCAHTVAGSARQAARAVEILPTEDDVAAAVGNPLSTFGFRPFIGNVEILSDGYRTEADATPIGCIAVTDTAPRIVYEPAPVLEVARQSYFNWDPGVDISGADTAVVRLSKADGARAMFESFVRRWQQCDGVSVVKRPWGQTKSEIDADVSEVREANMVLSATARTHGGTNVQAATYERAIGVRADTIVEVSLAVTPQGERRPTPPTPAVRLVQAMLDKVG